MVTNKSTKRSLPFVILNGEKKYPALQQGEKKQTKLSDMKRWGPHGADDMCNSDPLINKLKLRRARFCTCTKNQS
jgi:hypothetical protein